jgi:kynureninase
MFSSSIAYAKKADKQDPLRKFRKKFHFPKHKNKKSIYLCGNSLGLLSRNVKDAIGTELKDWKNLAINGYVHAKNPWLYYQHNFKRVLSRMMGCSEDEVTVMNALTVNLHLLMFSFYRPVGQRCKILMEAGAFPSDQYAVETQVIHHGLNPRETIIEVAPAEGEKILRTGDIIKVIEENKDTIALVLFGGINYYTGQLYDIKSITQAAHKIGAYAGFDLAHVAGNVPMALHEWKVDFAAWCSYKYLNAGPGSAGGVFIHETFGNDIHFARLAGWWGNEESTRFAMKKGFIPQKGSDGWNVSTAQVFNMVALKASLELFEKADIRQLRLKSIALTGYLEYLLKQLTNIDYEIITPEDPAQRGAQLSLYFKKNAKEIHVKLIENGVVVDYREPGVIRVAPAPLYNSFLDIFRFYEILTRL